MKLSGLLSSALLASLIATSASCRDSSLLGVSPPLPANPSLSKVVHSQLLLTCPQAYDSVSKVIGPKGGHFSLGSHYFQVDQGALADTVTITAVAPADTIRWVRFQPEGLVFKTNPRDGWGALLTTDYTNCVSTNVTGLRIAQITDALGVIQYLQTWTKIKQNPLGTGNQYVAAVIPHFSNYAVAW